MHKNGLEKPYSWYLVISQAFYKEWAEISRECVAIVNHKCVIYWVINYRKMKYVLEKHDAWHGAWRKYALEAIKKLLFISLFHGKCLLFMLELY